MKKVVILFLMLCIPFMLCAAILNHDVIVTRDPNPDAVYDTYQDWLSKNPQQTTMYKEMNSKLLNNKNAGFLIVVNDDLYESIEQSLLVYQQDLSNDGFNSFVVVFDGTSPIDIKQLIISYMQSANIVGVALVGNLPVAWYEMYEDWNNNGIQEPDENWVEFPCDLFFTDTDGVWGDADADGIFDWHAGEMHPEIGLGRIVADNMNILDASESELLNEYFQRNHLFRCGVIQSYNLSLAYIDDDWSYWGNEYYQAMLLAYPSVELVNDIEQTNANDYLNNRLISDYELIQVHVHSGPDAHYFYYNNGNNYHIVHNYEVAAICPTAHFYNLFACSNSRFTTSNNMGGLYIYCSEHCLATLGSTKTGSMLGFSDFYQPFSEDKTIGESLRLWWECNVDTAPYSGWERAWFYGMIIQGDPSLKIHYSENSEIFAYFEADNTNGYAPMTVNFSDMSVSPDSIISWQWDFQNDGIIDSYESNPSYTYQDTGSISVSLTVSSVNGSTDTELRENYLHVYFDYFPVHNITQGIGFETIQQGINAANTGDTIIVNEGVYYENLNFLGKDISVASNYLTERSISSITETIIDGNGANSVVKFMGLEDSTTILNGFTLRNGNYGFGGGILCYNSSPIIKNVVILNNIATNSGGGIGCINSSPDLRNVTITGNIAVQGGGIYCNSDTQPVIVNSILWNDTPDEIYTDSGSANISFSVIQGSYVGIGNINEDPLFADPANGDFNLTENSPCIDVGDPSSPLDPDGTIADMGALYFDQTISIDEPEQSTGFNLTHYPNPISSNFDDLTVSFSVHKPGNITIQLFNIKGQLVSTLLHENKGVGEYSISREVSDLSSGIYFTRLSIDGVDREIQKVVLLK